MKEKILRIEKHTEGQDSWESAEGYRIITDKQTITMTIDNYQSCCELWGYLMSEDDLDKFAGATLFDIAVTDTNRSSYVVENDYYEGMAMFVDIITSIGVLQFVAYNEHNGYYGHGVHIKSTQLTLEDSL